MRKDFQKFVFFIFIGGALCIQTTSCIFDSRHVFEQDTSHYREMRIREDSMLKAELARHSKMNEHPFEMESGHIIYLVQQKVDNEYSTKKIIEFSFEQNGKIQLYEEEYPGIDIGTMTSKNIYSLIQIKKDTVYLVLNPNNKRKIYTKEPFTDFDFMLDSVEYVKIARPVKDTVNGIHVFRYDLDAGKICYKSVGGLMLYQSSEDEKFRLIPYEVKWGYKIPAKKLVAPDDYQ